MPQTHHRYARPCLEIEYDRTAITGISCCGFVPVVFRVCGIDPQARLSISFQRVRKLQADDMDPRAYEVQASPGLYRIQPPFSRNDYREYHAAFLARAHSQETGTIQLQMVSAAGSLLVDVAFRFDPRQDRPRLTVAKGQLQALRFLPALRAAEARNALNGQYPASAGGTVLPVSDPYTAQAQHKENLTLPLFALDA
jgi:hypothetical protein